MLTWLLVLFGLPAGCDYTPPNSTAEEVLDTSPWLADVTDALGLDHAYQAGLTGTYCIPEIMGGGAGLLDYDLDGDLDLCLTNGNRGLPLATRGDELTNQLFRQESDGGFVDVTSESGLGDGGYGMGVAVGDVDNDGDPDVYFTNFGPDRLYLNQGDGTFIDATEAAGIDVPGWSSSAGFFDYDRDGDLDLFVARYFVNNPNMQCFDAVGRSTYCSPKAFEPLGDVLLRNEGDGTFTDVTESAGIRINPAAALGVLCEDLDDDGFVDVYVANDGYINHLWLNRGDGTFREAAVPLGCAYNLDGRAEASMGIVGADFDNDLDLDLFITHLSEESNTFYLNEDGGFLDDTGPRRLGISSVPYTGFGVAAIDIECDGDLDLVLVNGRVSRRTPREDASIGEPLSWLAEPNLVYINRGNGVFESGGAKFRVWTEQVVVSRGLATGDLDGDGDLDFVVVSIESPTRIFRNLAPRQGHWLLVRAIDPRLNRDAYHARLTLKSGEKSWRRTINPNSSYLSSNDPRAHFGLGSVESVDTIEVRWPDGLNEEFSVGELDREIELIRGTGRATS